MNNYKQIWYLSLFSIIILSIAWFTINGRKSNISNQEAQVIINFLNESKVVSEYCRECLQVRELEYKNTELNFLRSVPGIPAIEFFFYSFTNDSLNVVSQYERNRLGKIRENVLFFKEEKKLDEQLVEVLLPNYDNNFSPLSTRLAQFQNEGVYLMEIHCRDWRMELVENLGEKWPKKGPALILCLVFDQEKKDLVWESVEYIHYD